MPAVCSVMFRWQSCQSSSSTFRTSSMLSFVRCRFTLGFHRANVKPLNVNTRPFMNGSGDRFALAWSRLSSRHGAARREMITAHRPRARRTDSILLAASRAFTRWRPAKVWLLRAAYGANVKCWLGWCEACGMVSAAGGISPRSSMSLYRGLTADLQRGSVLARPSSAARWRLIANVRVHPHRRTPRA